MLYSRYYVASQFCDEKDVLEVGCGTGQGLGYLARRARKVVGGDYTERLLRLAREHYKGRIFLLRLDGHRLPFQDRCFDTVILFEAIYYLAQPEKFLKECRRVLRSEGVLLVCTANKDWYGFSRSAFSVSYFSANQLSGLLKAHHFDVELRGAFPVTQRTAKDKVVALLRRIAVALHLIPKTMAGKAILKRLFYGSLSELPAEIDDGLGERYPLVPIAADCPNSEYKVLYAIARSL